MQNRGVWSELRSDVSHFYCVSNNKIEEKLSFWNSIKWLVLYLNEDFNGFRSLFFYRFSGTCLQIRIIRRILLWIYTPKQNFYIGAGKIEPGGVFFHHPFSTIINADYIGNGCVFRNNTTIGNKDKNGKSVRPYFGNNVSVGPNCVIIGGITIGDNVTIGAGSVVVKNVPPNTIVVGNPAYIIQREGQRIRELL